MTDFYKFSTTLHELIHAKIGYEDSKFKDLETIGDHKHFADKYLKTMITGLKEYAKENKLELSEEDFKESAFVGLKGTKAFKEYIGELAKANKSTAADEEKAFDKRTARRTWKTVGIRSEDKEVVVDGSESDKFNVQKKD